MNRHPLLITIGEDLFVNSIKDSAYNEIQVSSKHRTEISNITLTLQKLLLS